MITRRRILLVEDEDQVHRYLKQLLEKADWQVVSARSGVDALSLLATTTFDLILCDLDLGSGPSGLDVQRTLPEIARTTPLVILTGHGTIDRCRDALRSGAADFIEKPIAPAKLLSALTEAVGRQRHQKDPCDPFSSMPHASVGQEHVRTALRTIDRTFSDPDFSVAILARDVGVSGEHIARLFRAQLGRSPLEQIHTARIEAAERLLVNTKLSVYEIALECGYRRTADLDEWFRHFKGTTPSELRRLSL